MSMVAGCAGSATYGYQYKMQQEFTGGEEPEPAPVEARQLLANAKTVAFYPPDQCINADPSITGRKLQELKANCGVMMSTLERAAQDAGYEVLSWQNLRGSKRAIEYAREANVDVLFEINDFEHDVLLDNQVQHTFEFFERHGDGNDTPLQVATPVAQQCANYAFQADKPGAAARTGAIDIKTVSVVDGRDRWHYRKTEQIAIERNRPKVMFSAPTAPNPGAVALITVGGIGLVAGGTLLAIEKGSQDNPLTPEEDGFDAGPWPTATMVIGALMIAGGIALQVGVGGKKPEPAAVLCDGNFAVAAPTVAPTVDNSTSSQYTFHTGTVAPPQSGANLSETQRRMLKEFIDTIVEARKAHGATLPPTQPAPTQPPQAAPPPPTP
jgi:hypothetical protein